MSPFTWLVVAIMVGSALTMVLLFGDSPNLRNSYVHRARAAVVDSGQFAARYFNRINETYFNNGLTRYFDRINETYFNSGIARYVNWSVPVFYVAVVTFCFYEFFTQVYQAMPPSVLHSAFHTCYIALTITAVYLSTYLATFSDPGVLSYENVERANRRFVNNHVIFFPDKSCRTCKLVKPARSKHCSVCNRCVMLFDHHCVWVNNCVGFYNFKWFVSFLVANINLLAYGGVICFRMLRFNNKQYQLGYWKLITSTTASVKISGVFVILCTIFVFITALFTGLHLRYLYLGVTTNELDKWSDIEYLINLRVLYYIVDLDLYVELASLNSINSVSPSEENEPVFINIANDVIVCSLDQSKQYRVKQITSMEKDLDNIYDLGFFANVKERIFTTTL